jgi:hypothetical protein
MGGKKPFVLAEQRDWMEQRFAAKSDLTLRELLAELHGRGIDVSYFALWMILPAGTARSTALRSLMNS